MNLLSDLAPPVMGCPIGQFPVTAPGIAEAVRQVPARAWTPARL